MLKILNPALTAMSTQCCPEYPYCDHRQRGPPIPSLQSHGLGLTFGETWETSMSTPYESHFSYARQPQMVHYSPNDMSPTGLSARHVSARSALPPITQRPLWPGYETANHDNNMNSWLGHRPQQHLGGGVDVSAYGTGGYEYASQLSRYSSFNPSEGSPSRATDLSTISASSQSPPAPIAANYDFMHKGEEGQIYLPQATEVHQLIAAHESVPETESSSSDEQTPAPRSNTSRTRNRHSAESILCKVCCKTFDRKSNWRSHIETHDKDRQRVSCKIEGCFKTFGRPAEMTRHVNSAHKQRSFTCISCNKAFTRNDILIRHRNDTCPIIHEAAGTRRRRGRGH